MLFLSTVHDPLPPPHFFFSWFRARPFHFHFQAHSVFFQGSPSPFQRTFPPSFKAHTLSNSKDIPTFFSKYTPPPLKAHLFPFKAHPSPFQTTPHPFQSTPLPYRSTFLPFESTSIPLSKHVSPPFKAHPLLPFKE